MVDRESSGKSRVSDKSTDDYEAPIGISKKTVVYLAIIALIAVLCFAYVTQLRKARRSGGTANETVTVSGTASTAAAETASTEAPAEEAPAADKPAAEEPAAEAPAEEADKN